MTWLNAGTGVFYLLRFQIYQADLMMSVILRDPSDLFCCLGWRQEGKECTIRKFYYSNDYYSYVVTTSTLALFSGFLFVFVCSCM